MEAINNPLVKICCISTIEEAEIAIACGADILGLVSSMPSGPGVISDESISEIIIHVNNRVKTFLLTSLVSCKEIVTQYNRLKPSSIQLVDALPKKELSDLRQTLNHVELIQVVHVEDESSINKALEASPYVDAILLDSGSPNKAIQELGGTGRTHNWKISKSIRMELDIPLYLAGGLNAENIQSAVEQVSPFGVDLCSGVRSDSKLDTYKLKQFMHLLKRDQ